MAGCGCEGREWLDVGVREGVAGCRCEGASC